MSDQFLDEFCTKLEAAIAENEAQSATVDQEISGHFVQLSRQLEGLADTLKAHKRAEDSLRQSLSDEIKSLRTDYVADKASVVDKQARIEQLEKECAEQVEAIQAGRRRVEDLVRVTEEREEALKQAQERCAKLEADLAAAQETLEVAGEGQQDTPGRGSPLRAELERSFDSFASPDPLRQASEDTLRTELQNTKSQLDEALSELESLRVSAEKIGTAERLLEAERQRANELEARIAEETSSGTRAVVAQQLADALRDLEASRTEVKSLRSEVEKLQSSQGAPEEVLSVESDDRVTTPRRGRSDRDIPKRSMNEILLEAGAITQEQLDEAVALQMEQPQRSLGEILVAQGSATEEMVAQAVAAEHRVLCVRLSDETIDPAAAALISGRIARQHRCVPMRMTDEALILAMVNPLNLIAIEDVERESNRAVRPVMATQSDITAAIDRLYAEASDPSS